MAERFTLKAYPLETSNLTTVVVGISIFMFLNGEDVQHRIGKRFIEGYAHRREPEYDPSTGPYYPGDDCEPRTVSAGGEWSYCNGEL